MNKKSLKTFKRKYHFAGTAPLVLHFNMQTGSGIFVKQYGGNRQKL